jgi:glycosyltransferase involved in cell wall biosynthesis
MSSVHDELSLGPPVATTAGRGVDSDCVAILFCTKDGAQFLEEQLESLANQTHKNWILIVSDDSSSDSSKKIIEKFATAHCQRVVFRDGPRQDFCQNFLSLATDPSIQADYFAFCDQDDVWFSDKLQRALESLATIPSQMPALYGTRADLITVDGRPCGRSSLFKRTPTFANALVQNIAGGNTLVFNIAAKRIIEQAGTKKVVAHDWWTYQLISAVGGIVRYDPVPSLKYRQHDQNIIGSNLGWRQRARRLRQLFSSRFRDWNEINVAALESCRYLIDPKNRAVLEEFAKSRQSPRLFARLAHFVRSGVYRQSWLDNIALIAAVILRKL